MVFTNTTELLEKISKIYDDMVQNGELFGGFDKEKLMKKVLDIINKIPSEYFNVSEKKLNEMIKGILAIEVLSGILNSLTPQQRKKIEDAIKQTLT